jgi:hypothetical protein
LELITQEAKGIIRARKETILAFLPPTVEEIVVGDNETSQDESP